MKSILLFCFLILFFACQHDSSYTVKEVENPFPENAMFPNLYADSEELVISYIHAINDSLDQLMISKFDGTQFSSPQKVASGKDWFVNWADFPALAKFQNHSIISWLDKSAGGTYDYDIKMSLSNNHGKDWGDPFIVHKDGINAEHGFVSLDVLDDAFIAVWLDGRNTKLPDENGKETYGQMTLRSAKISSDGSMSHELEIDERVCDCCQTDVKVTTSGTFAVYRNRSDEEIRDIYYSIFDGNNWSDPNPVHNDSWQISGCPVNGPAIASEGKNIAVTWYTESEGIPKVLLAHYDHEKNTFSSPVTVNDEYALGRVDIAFTHKGDLLVTFMKRTSDNRADIVGNLYDADLNLLETIKIGQTSASRSSGFTKIAALSKLTLVNYTLPDEVTKIKTVVIQ